MNDILRPVYLMNHAEPFRSGDDEDVFQYGGITALKRERGDDARSTRTKCYLEEFDDFFTEVHGDGRRGTLLHVVDEVQAIVLNVETRIGARWEGMSLESESRFLERTSPWLRPIDK